MGMVEGKLIEANKGPPRLVARNGCSIEHDGRAPQQLRPWGAISGRFRALVVATPEWLSAVATPLTGPHLVIESVSYEIS